LILAQEATGGPDALESAEESAVFGNEYHRKIALQAGPKEFWADPGLAHDHNGLEVMQGNLEALLSIDLEKERLALLVEGTVRGCYVESVEELHQEMPSM
jgi:hypothetical protein